MAEDWWNKLVNFLVGAPEDPSGLPIQYGVPVGSVGAGTRAALGSGRAGTSLVPRTAGNLRGPVRPSGSYGLPAGQRAVVTNVTRNPGTNLVARSRLPSGQGARTGVTPRAGITHSPGNARFRGRPRQTSGQAGPTVMQQNAQRGYRNRLLGGAAAAGALGVAGYQGSAALRNILRGEGNSSAAAQGTAGTAGRGNSNGVSDGSPFPGGNGGTNQPMDGWHARLAMGGSGGMPQAVADPYDEWMQEYINNITEAYDAQIAAIGGLGPLFQQQAAEAQSNIGDFFGYASDVATEGMPVTEEIYDTAQANVDQVYDGLASSLEAMPQEMVNRASDAAGGAIGSSVAGRVAAATAPFAAAGETSRANATANLLQGSSAGQSYLNNLASAAPAEGALHQSAVEQAMQQQLQLVAYKQAELEGAKQRALMDVTADVAGETSERMADAALAQALGLDLPANVDPLDYLRGQGMMPGGVDSIDRQKDLIQLQQAELNLMQDMNPNFRTEQILGNMSPNTRTAFDNLMREAESSAVGGADGVPDERAVAMEMLSIIDEELAKGREDIDLERFGIPNSARNSAVGADALDMSLEELQTAIRTLLM